MESILDAGEALCKSIDAVNSQDDKEPLKAAVRHLALRVDGRAQMAALESECADLRTRIETERVNLCDYTRRAQKHVERAEETALRPHILALLPVLDAIDLAKRDAASDASDAHSLGDAMAMIVDSLRRAIPQARRGESE